MTMQVMASQRSSSCWRLESSGKRRLLSMVRPCAQRGLLRDCFAGCLQQLVISQVERQWGECHQLVLDAPAVSAFLGVTFGDLGEPEVLTAHGVFIRYDDPFVMPDWLPGPGDAGGFLREVHV